MLEIARKSSDAKYQVLFRGPTYCKTISSEYLDELIDLYKNLYDRMYNRSVLLSRREPMSAYDLYDFLDKNGVKGINIEDDEEYYEPLKHYYFNTFPLGTPFISELYFEHNNWGMWGSNDNGYYRIEISPFVNSDHNYFGKASDIRNDRFIPWFVEQWR